MSIATLSLLTIALDQAVKFFLVRFFSSLVYYNKGIAFGLLSDTDAGIVVFFALSGLIVFFFFERFVVNRGTARNLTPNFAEIAGSALLIGGAVSNLLDRFLYGAIVDFAYFSSFYTFNLADFAVVAGAVIIAVRVLK